MRNFIARLMRALIPIVAIALFATGIFSQTPEATLALAQQFNERLSKQMEELPKLETLRQSYQYSDRLPPVAHLFQLRLGRGIEVVTESHSEDGVIEQKDYFFEEGKVYAHRVSHQIPCLDGKMKRVTENCFLIHEGKPFYRTLVTARVPLTEKEPNLSTARKQVLPLPTDLVGWGDQLTAHAYAIARTFRTGIGRYAFGDWDTWLFKHAPPEGTGEAKPRTADWLPPADTTVLPIPLSASPEGFYEIGWGYEKGPVDWKRLAYVESPNSDRGAVTFSTKLAEGQLTPELEADGNFLLSRINGQTIGKLALDYPGERQRFNHDEMLACWSPASTCFVTIATQKWFTEGAEIAWIKDGKCAGSNNILTPLHEAATEAVIKSKSPAAKRVSKDRDSFEFTLSKIMVEDDGAFEAKVVGEIPKDDAPGGYYEAIIKGMFAPKAPGEPAGLKVSKITILPPSRSN
ncbi:hypothetical protein BH11VER1_BH11VER1_07430 [soil metagenome]